LGDAPAPAVVDPPLSTGVALVPVLLLVAELEAAIEGQLEDTSDRETARWLLIRTRTRKALDEGPGSTHRTAAVHVQDLALICRALVALCDQQLYGPALIS
jgi:hypothetical protein